MNVATIYSNQIESLSGKLRVLSVETRLRMLSLLAKRNLCVGALACQLGVTQGAVSQHLKILRDAGLVTAEREGYFVHYRVDRQALADWQRALDELLERLQEERRDAAVAEGAAATGCKKRKEDACARRKARANAGKGTT
jgi:DNA-binding transcriptional ArsR family regulator